MKGFQVAIIGSTGLVGEEMLKCLATSNLPIKDLQVFASSQSEGQKQSFREKTLNVQVFTENSLEGFDFLFFASTREIARQFAPTASEKGAIVIDNSSAFRLNEKIPLIIPEINPNDLKKRQSNLIANPNCTTIITLMGLFPLHQKWKLTQMLASTYQAVSGSGKEGKEALKKEIAGKKHSFNVYPRPIAFNAIPQIGNFNENGYTDEELKLRDESRKILNLPKLKTSCTCVRIPVWQCHSISVEASFENSPSLKEIPALYQNHSGSEIIDPSKPKDFPSPAQIKEDKCLVGRLRKSEALENTLSLWIVGNQIRKGAALNAVQIAEMIAESQ